MELKIEHNNLSLPSHLWLTRKRSKIFFWDVLVVNHLALASFFFSPRKRVAVHTGKICCCFLAKRKTAQFLMVVTKAKWAQLKQLRNATILTTWRYYKSMKRWQMFVKRKCRSQFSTTEKPFLTARELITRVARLLWNLSQVLSGICGIFT